jgi:tetratricopeptide (TPR) repeat protein
MICSRFLIPSILIAAASAQVPAPVPAPVAPVPPVAPAAPVPHAAPAPAAAPVAPVAPVPPAAAVQPFDFDFHFDMPDMAEMQERIQEAQENMQLAREKMRIDSRMLLAQNVKVRTRYESDDRLYESGLNALGNHRYDAALDNFTQVTSRGGSRADAGWYYKANTLNKLGRRDEALAAIAE